MTASHRAQVRMEAAKRQFSDAARAALMGDPAAPELAREAYAEIQAAMADLRLMNDQEALR